MTPARPLLPWLMGAIIVLLSAALFFVSRDELGLGAGQPAESDARPPASQKLEVTVSAAGQEVAGIRTQALQHARLAAVTEAFGFVVNPAPLMELRARYLAARAEAQSVRAAAGFSGREHERLEALYADDRNVSQRAVQSADAASRSDQARLAGLERGAVGVRESLRAQWGEAIARLAGEPRAAFFDELSSQRILLVQLTLPVGAPAPKPDSAISVSLLAGPGTKRRAVLLSSAPFADPVVPGPTYLFRVAAAPELRVGNRVKAELAREGAAREGVAVPAAAVVYHGGKGWVYVRSGAESFTRREVVTREEIDGAWFNDHGLEVGESVVVSGAQLLLSEELKYQIRNENED
jgi:hypothetical protein